MFAGRFAHPNTFGTSNTQNDKRSLLRYALATASI
jgi:hypothetical protein